MHQYKPETFAICKKSGNNCCATQKIDTQFKVDSKGWSQYKQEIYLAHVIEQPNFRIPNPQYLQRNFCSDFFNDSENTF